jgi:hypothetical protein
MIGVVIHTLVKVFAGTVFAAAVPPDTVTITSTPTTLFEQQENTGDAIEGTTTAADGSTATATINGQTFGTDTVSGGAFSITGFPTAAMIGTGVTVEVTVGTGSATSTTNVLAGTAYWDAKRGITFTQSEVDADLTAWTQDGATTYDNGDGTYTIEAVSGNLRIYDLVTNPLAGARYSDVLFKAKLGTGTPTLEVRPAADYTDTATYDLSAGTIATAGDVYGSYYTYITGPDADGFYTCRVGAYMASSGGPAVVFKLTGTVNPGDSVIIKDLNPVVHRRVASWSDQIQDLVASAPTDDAKPTFTDVPVGALADRLWYDRSTSKALRTGDVTLTSETHYVIIVAAYFDTGNVRKLLETQSGRYVNIRTGNPGDVEINGTGTGDIFSGQHLVTWIIDGTSGRTRVDGSDVESGISVSATDLTGVIALGNSWGGDNARWFANYYGIYIAAGSSVPLTDAEIEALEKQISGYHGLGVVFDTVTIDTITQSSTTNSLYTNTPCRVAGTSTASDGTTVTVTVDGEAAGTGTVSSGAWHVDFIVTAAMVPAAGSGNPATVEASITGASDTSSVNVTTETASLLGWWDPSDSSTLSFDGSGNVNGITDKYNSFDLAWDAGAWVSTGVPTGIVNGLTVLDWEGHSDARRLRNTSASLVCEHIATACRYDATLPFNSYRGLITADSGSNSGLFLLGFQNRAHLYNTQGHDHYVDGVVRNDDRIDNSWHLIESERVNTAAGIIFGNDRDQASRGWSGPQGETLAWDSALSSGAREALHHYYGVKWATPYDLVVENVTQDVLDGTVFTNGRCRINGTSTEADGTTVTVTVDGETAGTGTVSSGEWYVDFLVTSAMVPAGGSGTSSSIVVSTATHSTDASINVTSEAVNVLGWYDPSESAYVSLDGSGNIDGLTDRSSAGNDLTWNSGSGASTGVPTTTVNGLTACDWGNADDKRWLENTGSQVIQYVSAVSRYDGVIPFDQYAGPAGANTTSSPQGAFFSSASVGASAWYDAAAGLNHFRDGVDTGSVDTSLHFYEAISSANTSTGLIVGNDRAVSSRSWNGPTGEMLALDAVPSSNYQEAELDYIQTKWGTP